MEMFVEGICLNLVDDNFKMKCQIAMYVYQLILDAEDIGDGERDNIWQDVVVVVVL